MTDDKEFDPEISRDPNDLKLGNDSIFSIPSDILFPNELNKFLKNKILVLIHENGILQKNLDETKGELEKSKSAAQELTDQIQKYEENNGFQPATNAVRKKIVDLSKRLREKNSEVEVCKSRVSKLEQEVANFQIKNVEAVEVVKEEKPTEGLEVELKNYKDKVAHLNLKLFEEKNQNLKLRNDLKATNKLLQDEIGDTLDNIQQTAGWRGRAEIITELQFKITNLKDKLKAFDKGGDNKNSLHKQRRVLLEKKCEKIAGENAELKAENAEFKKKFEAYKARLKTLDMESNTWKTKFATLTEQVEKSRELITNLTERHTNQNDDKESKKDATITKLKKEVMSLKADIKKEAFKAENAAKLLTDKETEFENFKKSSFSIHSTVSPRTVKDGEKSCPRLEAERIRLVELMAVINQRLNSERDARAKIEKLHRSERQRAAKLEANLARLKMEELTDRSSMYSSPKSNDFNFNLECKLELAMENNQALQTRLDIEKKERQLDLQEFSKIIRNYNFVNKE